MISSALEFKSLRESDIMEEYNRASQDSASTETWKDVLAIFPEMAFWVAQNKTVPLEILNILASNENVDVRCMVARKRKISEEIFETLRIDPDESVRHALMPNTKLPIESIKRIKTDDSEWLINELKEKVANNN